MIIVDDTVDLTEIKTLGDLAEVLRVLKGNGWTRGSALYVIDRVWWEGQN